MPSADRNQQVRVAFRKETGKERIMSDRKTVNPTESRQATPQRTNYRVLTRSLLIAVIAAAIVYAYFYLQTPG